MHGTFITCLLVTTASALAQPNSLSCSDICDSLASSGSSQDELDSCDCSSEEESEGELDSQGLVLDDRDASFEPVKTHTRQPKPFMPPQFSVLNPTLLININFSVPITTKLKKRKLFAINRMLKNSGKNYNKTLQQHFNIGVLNANDSTNAHFKSLNVTEEMFADCVDMHIFIYFKKFNITTDNQFDIKNKVPFSELLHKIKRKCLQPSSNIRKSILEIKNTWLTVKDKFRKSRKAQKNTIRKNMSPLKEKHRIHEHELQNEPQNKDQILVGRQTSIGNMNYDITTEKYSISTQNNKVQDITDLITSTGILDQGIKENTKLKTFIELDNYKQNNDNAQPIHQQRRSSDKHMPDSIEVTHQSEIEFLTSTPSIHSTNESQLNLNVSKDAVSKSKTSSWRSIERILPGLSFRYITTVAEIPLKKMETTTSSDIFYNNKSLKYTRSLNLKKYASHNDEYPATTTSVQMPYDTTIQNGLDVIDKIQSLKLTKKSGEIENSTTFVSYNTILHTKNATDKDYNVEKDITNQSTILPKTNEYIENSYVKSDYFTKSSNLDNFYVTTRIFDEPIEKSTKTLKHNVVIDDINKGSPETVTTESYNSFENQNSYELSQEDNFTVHRNSIPDVSEQVVDSNEKTLDSVSTSITPSIDNVESTSDLSLNINNRSNIVKLTENPELNIVTVAPQLIRNFSINKSSIISQVDDKNIHSKYPKTTAGKDNNNINVTIVKQSNDSKDWERLVIFSDKDIKIPKVVTREFQNDTVVSEIAGTEVINNNDFKNGRRLYSMTSSTSNKTSLPKETSENQLISGKLYFIFNKSRIPARFIQKDDNRLDIGIDGNRICKALNPEESKSVLIGIICNCVKNRYCPTKNKGP